MSKAAKGEATGATVPAEPPFEDALKKLESIVEEMESDELPLEKLLARFEEGSRLAQICQRKLAEAELKVQRLEKGPAGGLDTKPLNIPTSAEE